MRPMTRKPSRPLGGGLDPIGRFHPYVVLAAVLLLDLVLVLAILAAILWIGDKVEDVLFPGGEEWINF
jgi:hypothetical protein